MDDVVLIPYIEQESGAAEVWIGRFKRESNDFVAQARQALAHFASMDAIAMDDTEGLQDHCDAWGADRILLPTDEVPVRWVGYSIAEVLEGRLEETN